MADSKGEKRVNIVIPMAGRGSRFREQGFTFPKPLIEVQNKPMIQVVVDNLRPKRNNYRFIFICLREHYDKYNLGSLLNLIAPGCEIVMIDGVTAGAACTVLLAKEFINSDEEMVIANSDQYVEFSIDDFIGEARAKNSDGMILTFNSTHPKWSFAKTDKDGKVVEVAEKKPISNEATVGVYYYGKGRYFVEGAERMIEKDIRVNNEFYVCPVFNEMILDNRGIRTYKIPFEKMHGLGTPEDLREFLASPIVKSPEFTGTGPK